MGVVAECPQHVAVVGGLSVEFHGQNLPPEESVLDTTRKFDGWFPDTAPTTEQFVGDGVPALFRVSPHDMDRFETHLGERRRRAHRETLR